MRAQARLRPPRRPAASPHFRGPATGSGYTIEPKGYTAEADMAEEKKRGFGALEQRIHQMEEEDAKKERSASGESGGGQRQEQSQKDAEKTKR